MSQTSFLSAFPSSETAEDDGAAAASAPAPPGRPSSTSVTTSAGPLAPLSPRPRASPASSRRTAALRSYATLRRTVTPPGGVSLPPHTSPPHTPGEQLQPPESASSQQPSFLASLGIANVVAQDIAWVTAKEVEIVKSVCYAVAACLGLWLLHKWWYLRRYRRLRHKRLHFKSSTVSVAEEVFLPGISTWEGGMVCEANQFVPSSAVAQVLQTRAASGQGYSYLQLPSAALGWGGAEALQKGTPARKRRGRSSVRAVPQSSPGRRDPSSRSRSSRRAHSVRRGEGRGLLLDHEKTNFHESAFCSPTTRSPSFQDTTTAAAAANTTHQLPRKKRICLKYHDGSSWSARSGFHPTRGCEFSGTGVDEVYGKVTISGVFCPRTQRIYWEEQAVSEGRSIEYAGAFKPSSHLARVSRKGQKPMRHTNDAFEEDYLTRLLNTSGGSSSPCRKSSSIQVGRTVSRKVPVAVSEERKCRERENREKGKRHHKSAIEVIPVTRRHEPAPKRRCQSEKKVAEQMEGEEEEVGEDCKVQVECTSSGSEWVDADSGSCSPVSTSSVGEDLAHVQKSAEEYVGESRAGEDVAVETKLKEKKTPEKVRKSLTRRQRKQQSGGERSRDMSLRSREWVMAGVYAADDGSCGKFEVEFLNAHSERMIVS